MRVHQNRKPFAVATYLVLLLKQKQRKKNISNNVEQNTTTKKEPRQTQDSCIDHDHGKSNF